MTPQLFIKLIVMSTAKKVNVEVAEKRMRNYGSGHRKKLRVAGR